MGGGTKPYGYIVKADGSQTLEGYLMALGTDGVLDFMECHGGTWDNLPPADGVVERHEPPARFMRLTAKDRQKSFARLRVLQDRAD